MPSGMCFFKRIALPLEYEEKKENRIGELGTVKYLKRNDVHEYLILNMIYNHYFRSEVVLRTADQQLKERPIQELETCFGERPEEVLFKTYLLSNWYEYENWKFWVLRYGSKFSFSRKNMKVESQWAN